MKTWNIILIDRKWAFISWGYAASFKSFYLLIRIKKFVRTYFNDNYKGY